ncbi:hypothetical protein [Actinorugispora endophytica]|uniref:Uncharacterized protein n=1 Tax=Actinorugispora endophytica TaxID=1605990 RepID=A0A4R6V7K0_9ACTN|nr:hypothetical protein [Actinorugispora endophytica]TDQ52273.1 hypothetical protein EV190_107105 [Actinorugispora endophytica]
MEIAGEVHALVADLLPVTLPDASFDRRLSRVVVSFGWTELAASTWPLLERCAGARPHLWPRLAEEWLREVADRAALAVAEIELLGDVRELLRVKLVPRMPPDVAENLVSAPVGRYFDALVVIDHPKYGAPLTRSRAGLLGLRGLGGAVARTHERELADVVEHEWPLTLRHSVRVVTKPGSPYVSALLTELERFLPRPCPDGALVGVPRLDTLLLHPIASKEAVDLLPAFASAVADTHARADEPCAAGVFWWRDGTLAALDTPKARKAFGKALRRRRRDR